MGEPPAKLQRAFEKCESSKFSFCCAVDLLCAGIDAGIDSWFLFTFLLIFRFVRTIFLILFCLQPLSIVLSPFNRDIDLL